MTAGRPAPRAGVRPQPEETARAAVPTTSWGPRLLQVGAAVLIVAGLVSLLASPEPLVSLPWLLLIVVGAGLVLALSSEDGVWVARRLTPHTQLILGLGAGCLVLLLVLTGARWPAYKLSFLSGLYAALPTWRSLPWPSLAGGISPNQAGAMLAGFAAYAAAVTLAPVTRTTRRWSLTRAAAAGLAVTGTGVVIMTGSRAALAGIIVALALVLVLRDRRWLWLVCGLAVMAGAVLVLQPRLGSDLLGLAVRDEALGTKLLARLDIWLSALRAVQDHPFTGIGLGVLNDVLPVRYPYETVGLSYTVTHAHNAFLDIALTMGLVGLAGFLLLLAGVIAIAGRALRIAGRSPASFPDVWAAAVGALAGMTVFVVFGMTDSLSVSTISGVFLWIWPSLLAVTSHYTTQRST